MCEYLSSRVCHTTPNDSVSYHNHYSFISFVEIGREKVPYHTI